MRSKGLAITLMGIFVYVGAYAGTGPERQIRLTTKKIKNATHWVVEGKSAKNDEVEVTPGEKVKFVVTHNLKGGYDIHGFTIKALGVEQQVSRRVNPQDPPLEVEVTVPKTLKPGKYPIGCQFHPSHVGATLVVKADTKNMQQSSN